MSDLGGVIFKDNLNASAAPEPEPPAVAPPPEAPSGCITWYKKVSAETRAQPARIADVIDGVNNVANFVLKDFAEEIGEAVAELVNTGSRSWSDH